MRPSLRLLQLPPLPPRAKWLKTFPTSNFHIVNRLSTPLGTAVGKGKRTQVADKSLANSIVHAVRVTKDQVVLEAYPGMGFITRALLELPPDQHPRRVITVEPAIDFNVRGLGLSSQVALDGYSLEEDHDKTTKLLLSQRMEANDRAKHALLNTRNHAMQTAMNNMFVQGDSQRMEHSDEIQSAIDPVDQPPPDVHIFRAFPSADDPTLTIIDGTMFDWKTVPQMEAQGLFSQVTRREWQDEPPNLHLIAQIPDSDMGEQLVSQWIGCIASHSWLFRWGRVKMSFVVRPALYDRLTALPGSKAYSKLSVFTSALAERIPGSDQYTPGPDSHIPLSLLKKHEKEQREKEQREPSPSSVGLKPRRAKNKPKVQKEPKAEPVPANTPQIVDPMLSTDPDLWYPKPRRNLSEQKAPPRPGMMVISLIPRRDLQIRAEDKDVWDYVLRRMFVNQGSPLAHSINNLGMGAANLIPKLTNPNLPEDQRIDPDKWIREYTVQDWALVVKAFKEWPFAPDVLVLGGLMEEDNDVRQMGSGM